MVEEDFHTAVEDLEKLPLELREESNGPVSKGPLEWLKSKQSIDQSKPVDVVLEF